MSYPPPDPDNLVYPSVPVFMEQCDCVEDGTYTEKTPEPTKSGNALYITGQVFKWIGIIALVILCFPVAVIFAVLRRY